MDLLERPVDTAREPRRRPTRSIPAFGKDRGFGDEAGGRARRLLKTVSRPLVEPAQTTEALVEDREDVAVAEPEEPRAVDAAAIDGATIEERVSTSVYLPSGSDTLVDGLQLYLREVGRSHLLTAAEEVELAQEIEAGREARAKLDGGKATAAEVLDLLQAVDRGEAARQRLISANLRLVISMARQHLGPDVEFADLIQEGNLGLMRAVDRFDWRRGNRFSTYALWWIRQATSCAAGERSRSIRLPSHMMDTLSRLAKTEQRLAQELGHHPTDLEICQSMGISIGKLADLRQARERPSSLEAPIGEGGDGELADVVEDPEAPTPLSAVLATSLRDLVDEALRGLDAREQKVIRLRYGLEDDHPRTLEEVGRILQVTKERVRQIEGRAIRKLRHSSHNRWLVEYAD